MASKKSQEMIPTLLVGVGGTGYKTLKIVKKKFLECSHYGNKVPPMINFLSFDTDKNMLDEDVFSTSEKFLLDADTSAILGNINQFPHIKKWFPVHRIRETIAHGARQIRALGRLALFSKINGVIDAIRASLTNIYDKKLLAGEIIRTDDSVPVNVYIVTSTCGGTGSGMLLDISYIIRQIIQQQSMLQPEIYGYLSMPDSLVNIPDSSLERIKANSAAALKEIDLFMEGTEIFSTKYTDNFAIKENIGMMKPFDFCYLISGVDITEQATITKVVAEQIFHGLGTGPEQSTNKSYFSNIPTLAFKPIISGEFIGKKTNYSSLGVASCVIPIKKVVELLANRFSADLMNAILEYTNPKDGKTLSPWEQDAVLFNRNNFLEINAKQDLKLLDKIYDIGKLKLMSPLKFEEHKASEICDIMVQDISDYARYQQDVKKSIAENRNNAEVALIKNYVALVSASMGDAARGSGFVIKTSEYLYRVLEQFRVGLGGQRNVRFGDVARFNEAAGEKKASVDYEVSKTWLLRSDRRIHETCVEWVNNMNSAFSAQAQLDRLEAAIEVVDRLMAAIKSNVDELKKFKENVKFLKNDIFTKRATYSGASLDDREGSWLLEYPVIETSDLERLYRDSVNNPDLYESVFVGKGGLNIIEKWTFYANNRQIFEIDIMNYTTKIIEDKLKDLTIEKFLTEKSKVTSQNEIKKVGEALALKGKPLWQVNRGLFPSVMERLNIVGVYDRETSKIDGHIQDVLRNKLAVVSTKDPYRITIVQTEHGAPLYAISKIEDWEGRYKKYKKTEFLHAITEEEYGIEWDNYPFRPPVIDKSDGLRNFTLGMALNFIQVLTHEKKICYFCTTRPEEEIDPNNKRDIFLGNNRLDAFENFMTNQQVRKLSVLVEKALEKVGTFREQMSAIVAHARSLKADYDQIDNPELQELLREEIRSLSPLLKELDVKRSKEEAETKMKKAKR